MVIILIMAANAFAAITSGTFQVAKTQAMFRAIAATDPDEKIRNADTMAIKYCPSSTWDFFIEDFAISKGMIKLHSASSYFYLNAASKHVDVILEKAIKDGVRQVVLLRPLYDSSAYRFHKAAPDVKYYEVDLPEIQAEKIKLTKNILGVTPDWVSYVPFDFHKQNIAAELKKAGYDEKNKTLFIFAGTQYTAAEVADSLLKFIANHTAAGSSVVFEYVLNPVLEKDYRYLGARASISALAAWGIKYIFGINDGEVESVFNKNGLALISDSGPEELTKNYLIKSNGKVDGRMHGFFKIAYAGVPEKKLREKLLKKPYKEAKPKPVPETHTVSVSADIQDFLSQNENALLKKDVGAIMNNFSEKFLNDGATKDMASGYWAFVVNSPSFAEVNSLKIIVTELSFNGDTASLTGFVRSNAGLDLFESIIIKENGKWKHYGNQKKWGED